MTHLPVLVCLFFSLIVVSQSITDNAVAGGSGYALRFDWTRADVLSLVWDNAPQDDLTIEFWCKLLDPHMTYSSIMSYSVYNSDGRFHDGGAAYEQANEINLGLSPTISRFFHGTQLHDCDTDECVMYSKPDWFHWAVRWNRERGEVGYFVNGEALDLGYETVYFALDNGADISVTYSSAPWGAARQFDTGITTTTISGGAVSESLPCSPFSAAAGGVVVLERSAYSTTCSDYDVATQVEASGAIALLVVQDPTLETEGDKAALAFDTPAGAVLSIPVWMADSADATDLLAALTSGTPASVKLFRSKATFKTGGDMMVQTATGGVLVIAQEADAPWSDFDEQQVLDGLLDEFRVWNTFRSESEIRDNYLKSIDSTSADLADMNIYWRFDTPNGVEDGKYMKEVDISPSGNDGFIGTLPTLTNELRYSTKRPTKLPTSPIWLPSASPLVGAGAVVVSVVPSVDETITLASYDPDGDDLTTLIVSMPAHGELLLVTDVSTLLGEGDEVLDGAGVTQNKRVVYRPTTLDGSTATSDTFTYSVSDGGTPVEATVEVISYTMPTPKLLTGDDQVVLNEDQLTYIVLSVAGPRNNLMGVEITGLPEAGTLYQAAFAEGSSPTYQSVVADGSDPNLVKIDSVNTMLTDVRGMVLFLPDLNAASDGEVYTSFKFRYFDALANQWSQESSVDIVVVSVNDAPAGTATPQSTTSGEALTIMLSSEDVDADSPQAFAPHPFARVTKFPSTGLLYQVNEDGSRGDFLDSSRSSVPTVFSWAFEVLRFSSQYSLCGTSCFSWANPVCNAGTVCHEGAWMAHRMLGEPDVYPLYGDYKNGWDLSQENYGTEWIELRFAFDLYVSALDIYETFKPGAVTAVYAAETYIDDRETHCSHVVDVECSRDTDWRLLWSTTSPGSSGLKEEARIFSPPLCPYAFKAAAVRIELDTSADVAPGWNNYDAAKLTGSLEFPPGLLAHAGSLVWFQPTVGVHGTDVDTLEYVVTDCEATSTESTVVGLSIVAPTVGFTEAWDHFYTVADVGVGAVDVVVPLGSLSIYLESVTGGVVDEVEVEVMYTSSGVVATLGSSSVNVSGSGGAVMPLSVTLAEASTDVASVELWFTLGALTVRRHVLLCAREWSLRGDISTHGSPMTCQSCDTLDPSSMTESELSAMAVSCDPTPRCVAEDFTYEVGGCVDETEARAVTFSWLEPKVCARGVSLPEYVELDCYSVPVGSATAGLVTMLAIVGAFIAAMFAGLVGLYRQRPIIKYAQRSFCLLFCFGAAMVNLSLLAFVGDNNDTSCVLRPWLFHISSTIMFGGLFVKVWRVAKLFSNASMKKMKIPNALLFSVVLRLLLVDVVILMVWTIVSPPKAVTKVETEAGVGEVEYVICESDKSFLPTVAFIWKCGLILYGCYLAYLTRDVDSRFSESKHIFLAIYNLAFVGGLTLLMSQFLGVKTLTAVFLQALGTVWCSSTSLAALLVPKLLNLSAAPMTSSTTTGKETTLGGNSTVIQVSDRSDELEAMKAKMQRLMEQNEALHGEVEVLRAEVGKK